MTTEGSGIDDDIFTSNPLDGRNTSDQDLLDVIHDYITKISPWVAVVLNWFCVLVLRHGRARRNTTPAITFLVFLSYFDSTSMILTFYLAYSDRWWGVTTLGCQITTFLSYSARFATIWLIVFIAVERRRNAKNKFYPCLRTTMVNVTIYLWFLIIFVHVEHIFVFFWMKPVSDTPITCPVEHMSSKDSQNYMLFLVAVNIFVNYIIPFVILFRINILLIRDINRLKTKSKRQLTEIQLTIIVIMLSAFTMSALGPFAASNIQDLIFVFAKDGSKKFPELYLFGEIFANINHSCRFVVYLLFGALFRTDFYHMMCCLYCKEGVKKDYYLRANQNTVVFVQSLTSQEMMERDNVTFTCETLDKGGRVLWFKDDDEITQSSHFDLLSDGKTHKLVIYSVSIADSGIYTANVGIHSTSGELRVVERTSPFIKLLEDVHCFKGETVTFTCETTQFKCHVTWKKGSEELTNDDRIEFMVQGHIRKMVINKVVLSDAGMYTVTVDNESSFALLDVKAKSDNLIISLEDKVCGEGDDVIFECKPRPTAATSIVTWEKDGKIIRSGTKYQMTLHKDTYQLVVSDLGYQDSGYYTFVMGNLTSSGYLEVAESHDKVTIQDTMLSVLERVYPATLSLKDLNSMADLEIDKLQTIQELLTRKELIKQDEPGLYIRHTKIMSPAHHSIDHLLNQSWEPHMVVVTYNYCEMLAVEAMMTDRTVYLKSNQIYNEPSMRVVTGYIGHQKVLATKLGVISEATTSKITNIEAMQILSDKVQSARQWLLVGLAEGVPHSTLGDVIVSTAQFENLHHLDLMYFEGKQSTGHSADDVFAYPSGFRNMQDALNELLCIQKNSQQLCSVWHEHYSSGMKILQAEEHRPCQEDTGYNKGEDIDRFIPHETLDVPDMLDPINMSHPYNTGSTDDMPTPLINPMTPIVIEEQTVMVHGLPVNTRNLSVTPEMTKIISSLNESQGNPINWVIIRGIADTRLGDWHPKAALHAAALVKSVLVTLSKPSD